MTITFSARHVGIALLVVASFGLAIVGGHQYGAHRRASQAAAAAKNDDNAIATLTHVQNRLDTNYPALGVSDNMGWTAEHFDANKSVRVPGYDFDLVAATEPHIIWSWVGEPTYLKMREYVSQILGERGLAQSEAAREQNKNGHVLVFTGKGQRCSLEEASGYTDSTGYAKITDTLHCAATNSLTIQARAVQPFAQAYEQARRANPKLPAVAYVQTRIASEHHDGGVIKPSKAAGYDLAEVSAYVPATKQHRILLFYRHNNGWKYAVSAHDEYGFACGEISAIPEAKIAMQDQYCHDYEADSLRSQ